MQNSRNNHLNGLATTANSLAFESNGVPATSQNFSSIAKPLSANRLRVKFDNKEQFDEFVAWVKPTGIIAKWDVEDYYHVRKKNSATEITWSSGSSLRYKTLTYKEALVEQFKKGDKVLVRDHDDEVWEERIYLTTIENAEESHLVVCEMDEEEFKSGNSFGYIGYAQIKAIPEKTVVKLSDIKAELKEKYGDSFELVLDK